MKIDAFLTKWSRQLGQTAVLLVTTVFFAATSPARGEDTPPPAEPTLKAAKAAPAPLIDQEDPAPPRPAHRGPRFDIEGVMALSIPIIAIVLGIGIGAFAVWLDYKKRERLLEACHEERMTALEKGLEVPPFPSDFESTFKKNSPRGTGLKPALIFLGLGAGLYFGHQREASAIIFFLGVAMLLYYLIEGRKFRPWAAPSAPVQ